MGLFDRKNNHSDKAENQEGGSEKKEVQFPFLTILVDEVLSMTSTEVSVIGNVRGGTLTEGDELYLLGRKNKSVKTRAVRIEDALMSKMQKAEEGTNVSVVLEGLRQGDVEKFDVLSSVNCIASDTDTPDTPVNPFLSGLLREAKGRREDTDREYMGRVMEYIATEAVFLTPCMHADGKNSGSGNIGVVLLKGKDQKNYLAVFTDIHELEIMEGMPEHTIQPMDFGMIMNYISKGPIFGLLINPKSEGFVMTKSFLELLANHKRKVDNNLKEQKIDPKQPMLLAVPKEGNMPDELFGALRSYMETEPSILRAWYALMIFPQDNDRKAHLIIVDTLEETPELFGAIGRAAREHVDGMQINMQSASKVGKMTEKMMLFYERKDDLKV